VTLPPERNVIQYEAYPAVPVPSIPCTNADLSAAATAIEPSMEQDDVLVKVTSSVPCYIEGYPDLGFWSAGQPVATDVEDGQVPGGWAPPSPVAVGSGAPASFMIGFVPAAQFGTTITSVTFALAGDSPTIPVAPIPAPDSANTVGGYTGVTPFEQGNSLDQYA
jgi:Protein of unknown function (DUF4232)